MSICFVIIFIWWILIGFWMYQDAEKRGRNGELWLIIGIFSGVIGLIIWLAERPEVSEEGQKEMKEFTGEEEEINREDKRSKPDKKFCKYCGTEIDKEANFCKNCGKEL